MAKQLMFSKVFPKGHPKAGQKTRFVELLWVGILRESPEMKETMHQYLDKYDKVYWDIKYIEFTLLKDLPSKIHTIRGGFSRHEGQIISPRIWIDKPYHSKTLTFAPDMAIKHIEEISIRETSIDDNPLGELLSMVVNFPTEMQIIAQNDGLSLQDFKDWFRRDKLEGQILIFSNINPYKQ
jgi:hypothetical protein